MAPSQALAAGSETSRRAHDLLLTVDTRWAGGASGGYYPIRMRLSNFSRARTLDFVFSDAGVGGSRSPTVSRQVQIDQNGTQHFSLSIPLVTHSTYGSLRVLESGRELEQFTQHVSLPENDDNWAERPSLLVISPSPANVDCSQFEAAVQSLAGRGPDPRRAGSFSGGSFGSGWSPVRSNDFQVIAPTILPESWIDYTALDLLAIPLATFEKAPAESRAAILKWTAAGGTLIVFDVGRPASESDDLSRLLETAGRAPAFQKWEAADPALHTRTVATLEAVPGAVDAEGNPVHVPATPVWPVAPETFSKLDLMAGRVYAFPGNPFPGSAIDWAWWISSARMKKLDWTARHGMSSRHEHPEFNQFLIKGVGSVPLLAFVLLISIFAVAIGPVNYFVVWRRKQLYLLVVTIPAIAFVTSAALFGYAAIADGFGVRSRLRSLTILDQFSKTAVSFNRISLYAGIGPSDGLRFSPETAVYPVWSRNGGFESGSVDWSQTQHLARGWLHSRTRTQFETVNVRAERGRVELRQVAEGMEAANGLAWNIDLLLVKDEQGRLFAGSGIPAGGSARLAPATPETAQALAKALAADPLRAPPGADATNAPVRGVRHRYSGDDETLTSSSFSSSLLEKHLDLMEKPAQEPAAGGLPVRSYLATLAENPGIELGVKQTRSSNGLYVVLGYY